MTSDDYDDDPFANETDVANDAGNDVVAVVDDDVLCDCLFGCLGQRNAATLSFDVDGVERRARDERRWMRTSPGERKWRMEHRRRQRRDFHLRTNDLSAAILICVFSP